MHDVEMGALDSDGKLDVVAKMHQATAPQKVAIYTNQGEGRAWRKRGIATSGSHNIVLVDLLNDSRLSIYGANWNNNTSTGRIIELWVG